MLQESASFVISMPSGRLYGRHGALLSLTMNRKAMNSHARQTMLAAINVISGLVIRHGQMIWKMGRIEMSIESQSATLGVPYGRAQKQLRKILLFDLLKRYKENVCARCGNSIRTLKELSVDHLKPWEGISAKLFWDLKNIAFSHLSCNIKCKRSP